MRLHRAIGLLCLALACQLPNAPPPFVGVASLRIGGAVPLDGGASLVFVGVGEDSRCPAEAVCVWAGNAAVLFSVRLPELRPPMPVTINTTLEPRALEYGATRVTIWSLNPAPSVSGKTDPSKYVVEVRCSDLTNPEV